MMPSFPRPSLSFRTAGFPRYAWKAGISGGAFPHINQLKPTPGIHWLMFGLRPPFVHFVVIFGSPHSVGPRTRSCTALEGGSPSAPEVLALVRVMLSSTAVHLFTPSVTVVV